MKELNDTERLEVAMGMLDEQQVDEYAVICKALEQDCERNGFHNTPAECEDRECNECELDADARTRLDIDCPYVD